MKLKRVHFLSGLTLAIFIGMHLFNHYMSIYGADRHIEVMHACRGIYRNIWVETALMIAVVVQIISGLKLFKLLRKNQASKLDRLQIWTGFYMAIFLVLHISAVMVGRFVLKLDTNFYFGVAGLNKFPFNLFFIPYYGLAIIAFYGHIAAIHGKKMKKSVLGLSPNHQSTLILVLGFMVTLIVFYGLTNHFEGVVVPEEYKILTGK